MSTGMGCLSEYRIQTISNSTEIGTSYPKITHQILNFPLSNLRSPLYAHTTKFPKNTRSTLNFIAIGNASIGDILTDMTATILHCLCEATGRFPRQ